MTRPRNDSHSTEFGLWLRKQPKIGSGVGFNASNLDYIWENYKTGKWMLIEEKRYKKYCTWAQSNLFKKLNDSITDPLYCGFHVIRFENTSPEDGKIWWDNKEITTEELLDILRFSARTP